MGKSEVIDEAHGPGTNRCCRVERDAILDAAFPQGGLGEDTDSLRLPPISHENTSLTGIKHTDGVISMARLEPGTASSEFFICINDQPSLDFGGKRDPNAQGYAAFGKVVKGMEVVRNIQRQPERNQFLVKPVMIRKVFIEP